VTLPGEHLTERMEALASVCRTAQEEFQARYASEVEQYRQTVSNGVKGFRQDLEGEVRQISGDNATCNEIARKTTEYLDWLQWSFWDLPYYALALGLSHERLELAIRTCGMAYLSARIIDDAVDRHFSYKGRHATLLSIFEQARLSHQKAEGLTILGGLLVCFSGLVQLADRQDEMSRKMLARSIECLRHTIIGAMMEMSPRESWDSTYYERMVELKNVEFWSALYAGVDSDHASPLYPFMKQYYALAQKLNDVADFFDDNQRAQPNLLALHIPHNGNREGAWNGQRAGPVPESAEQVLARDFLSLADMAYCLPSKERLVALLKLGEYLDESFRLGLFSDSNRKQLVNSVPKRRLGLEWYSTFEDVVQAVGADAVVEVDCAICKSSRRKRLFEKQGFHFHRCLECRHIYVSPRIRGELAWQMGQELDGGMTDSVILEAQKFYSASICRLLRARAPGPRLLDIGFGRGYVLQLAKSYGFEVYGLETSPSHVERLRPQFGDRLHLVTPGAAELPWTSFDVVVISHVIEHLEQPDKFLGEVFGIMNPEGVLYVAVPDMNSVQFQLFGKKWEVISPLAHFQYFEESGLRCLLKNCLFADAERVEHLAIREEIVPRWIRLLRRLGATDAGELAMVCRRPAF
jgi:2-polyprenyl-3-methyl-5-hydroxy-6-metoxy-1,4-benzoquinol methylase